MSAATGAEIRVDSPLMAPDLAEVIARWPALPPEVRAWVLALVRGDRPAVASPASTVVEYLGDGLAGEGAVRQEADSPGSPGVSGVAPGSGFLSGRGDRGSPGLKGDEWTTGRSR